MSKEYFEITSVSREDLEQLGYDTTNVSDDTMESIAEMLADDYCEQLFWGSLRTIIEDCFNIPKRDK